MRTRRTKEQIRKDNYNKDVDAYNFYVVNLDTMRAETGFEFKEDAVDLLNDYDDKKKYKVFSKRALKSMGVENPNESFKYGNGGSLIGNQKRIDLNKNGKIDAEDFKLLRSSMNGAYRNERKHVNHNENYEVRYSRNKPSRTGYKGKRDFALGGIFGGRTYSTGRAYTNERRHVNHNEDYEIRYAKPRPSRAGYKSKRNFAEGGSMEKFYLVEIPAYNSYGKEVGKWYRIYDDKKNIQTLFLKKRLNSEQVYSITEVSEKSIAQKILNEMNSNKHNPNKVLKGEKEYASGGSLGNHGLKKGDRIIRTIDGGIQEVKDKDGNTIYVNLANGERSADVPLPFDNGGKIQDSNPYVNVEDVRSRYELLNDMYSNEESEVDYVDILKSGDVVYGDGIIGFARIEKEVNDPIKGDYFILQDRFNGKFGIYVIQLVRDLRSKEIFLQNVSVSEKDFLYSKELIELNSKINYLKGKVRLYEKNPNDASNYHGINYQEYASAKSEVKELQEDFKFMLRDERRKFEDGGEVTYFVNKDGIRVRSVAKPDKKLSEKEWMAKHSESKEARAYAGGGEIRVGDILKKKNSSLEVKVIDSGNDWRSGKDYITIYQDVTNSKVTLVDWSDYEKVKTAKMNTGGKVSFSEKSRAIARNFVGKQVEPKYQKEYGKTYDAKEAKEAKEVGNKIAGAQKASYNSKAEKGAVVKKKSNNPNAGKSMQLAKEIRKDGEKWTDAVKRASAMLKDKK